MKSIYLPAGYCMVLVQTAAGCGPADKNPSFEAHNVHTAFAGSPVNGIAAAGGNGPGSAANQLYQP